MCDASLSSFPLGPPVYVCVCYTALRARGACPLQGYCLLNLFTWPTLTGNLFVRGTGRIWTAGLMTTGYLVEQLRLWQPWHSFRTSVSWTDVAWHSCFITISVSNQFRYYTGLQKPRLSCWSAHFTPTLVLTMKCWLGRNKLSLQHNAGCKLSQKSEEWNAILSSKWGPSKEEDGRYRSVYCSLLPHYRWVDRLSRL